jgi:hypothetical protein
MKRTSLYVVLSLAVTSLIFLTVGAVSAQMMGGRGQTMGQGHTMGSQGQMMGQGQMQQQPMQMHQNRQSMQGMMQQLQGMMGQMSGMMQGHQGMMGGQGMSGMDASGTASGWPAMMQSMHSMGENMQQLMTHMNGCHVGQPFNGKPSG